MSERGTCFCKSLLPPAVPCPLGGCFLWTCQHDLQCQVQDSILRGFQSLLKSSPDPTYSENASFYSVAKLLMRAICNLTLREKPRQERMGSKGVVWIHINSQATLHCTCLPLPALGFECHLRPGAPWLRDVISVCALRHVELPLPSSPGWKVALEIQSPIFCLDNNTFPIKSTSLQV